MFTLATSIATYLTGYTLDRARIDLHGFGIYLALGSLVPIILWGIYRARYK